MKIINIKKNEEKEILSYFKNRAEEDFYSIDVTVKDILNRVKKEGDKALSYYNEVFDKANVTDIRVTEKEIETAYSSVEQDFKDALTQAAQNIRAFHEKQLEKTWKWEKGNGVILGQLINPMENVGVYVPGGKAAYPSTVLMNIIPAKIAGVNRIVMVTPPSQDGSINPYILTAAKIAGADEIYKVGGAQAVAALAYGTESIKPVKKIVGPGNIYVARAKKLLFGMIDIDMIAGPSEVCIIADEKVNPEFAAADLLSQAEHDEMAASIMITTSEAAAQKVKEEVELQLTRLSRMEIAQKSIESNGIIIVAEDLDSAFVLSNMIAPEHLELLIDQPFSYLDKVKNAGAVFLGNYSPEPLGDYFAGPNHTLPTSGTAQYASPLGVYDFIKKSSIIYYPEEVLYNEKDKIVKIAEKEGLTAHANSIRIRFDKEIR